MSLNNQLETPAILGLMEGGRTNHSHPGGWLIGPNEPILITGAGGFMGPKVIQCLLDYGFRDLRCFVRPSSNSTKLEALSRACSKIASVSIIKGNLLSAEDCSRALADVKVVYHLAAARGEKSIPDAFMNSAVTTRNLLEASGKSGGLKRFVSLSSFSVYSNRDKPRGRILDETCPVEDHPEIRGDAYTFAKRKQDQIVIDYGTKLKIAYVIVRPGYVYGPGNEAITGRVGIGTFGLFLHLGGGNSIPLSYVDNCAEAIVLAGLKPGVEGEVFNVVDDDLPSSRAFLRLYKKNVKRFRSVYVPHWLSYLLCCAWEKYSGWSYGQLPPAFNRAVWHSYWKPTRYANEKLKTKLGWRPKVASAAALEQYFKSCRLKAERA